MVEYVLKNTSIVKEAEIPANHKAKITCFEKDKSKLKHCMCCIKGMIVKTAIGKEICCGYGDEKLPIRLLHKCPINEF